MEDSICTSTGERFIQQSITLCQPILSPTENRLRPLETTHLHPVLRIARRALVDRDNFVKHAQNAV